MYRRANVEANANFSASASVIVSAIASVCEIHY